MQTSLKKSLIKAIAFRDKLSCLKINFGPFRQISVSDKCGFSKDIRIYVYQTGIVHKLHNSPFHNSTGCAKYLYRRRMDFKIEQES